MAETKGPSIIQDRAAALVGHARLSPLGLALAISLAAHLAVAAALLGRSADDPPTPRSIIAVEIVAGPPGQNARRRARSIAAAPGAAAKPKPSDPETRPDPKLPKTRQVANATTSERPPHDEPAEAPDRPTATEPTATEPTAKGAATPPPAPKVATTASPAPADVPPAAVPPVAVPPRADATAPRPKAARPPVRMDDAPPTPAPRAAVTVPKAAAEAPVRTGRTEAPRTEPETPPSTALLAAKPTARPEPPKAVQERAKVQRRRARRQTARQRQARERTARRPTRSPTATRQTASAPAGAYVPPRPGRGSGRNRPPVYPRRAQREGWQGRVLLFVQVAASGQVTAVRVQRSSGHGILDQAALRAVRGWRFDPARRGSSPVAGTLVVPVRFRLTN